MSAMFRLNGLEFIALNGGPQYKFAEAIIVGRLIQQTETRIRAGRQ